MGTVNLDLLIGDVDRLSQTTDEVDRVRTAAQLAGELQAMADDLVAHFVELARNMSRSWSDIGDALGVTRQAAAQRFVAPVEVSPIGFDDEVQQAFAASKDTAIRYRHNFIGTEHLLLGLLAHDNAATAQIARAGAAPDAVRASTEARMTLGGSQAAARIPWTPYARKVAGLAVQHATALGRTEQRADDWLAGLIALGRGTAAEVLAAHGITDMPADVEPQKPTKRTAKIASRRTGRVERPSD